MNFRRAAVSVCGGMHEVAWQARNAGDEHDRLARAQRGRRGRLRAADRALPPRAPAPLLPDPRLAPGRRGPAPGDAAGGLARARAVRGPLVAARVAVHDRHQPLPERAARRAGAGPMLAPGDRPTRRSRPGGRDRSGSQPYPDALLEGWSTPRPGPRRATRPRRRSALAFVSGLQHLAPRQRAVLVLRDVLGFHADEVADMLGSSEASVNSALQRARATLEQRLPPRPRAARRCPAR